MSRSLAFPQFRRALLDEQLEIARVAAVHPQQPRPLEVPPDGDLQLVVVLDGFEQVVPGALTQSTDRFPDVARAGHHDHGHAIVEAAVAPQATSPAKTLTPVEEEWRQSRRRVLDEGEHRRILAIDTTAVCQEIPTRPVIQRSEERPSGSPRLNSRKTTAIQAISPQPLKKAPEVSIPDLAAPVAPVSTLRVIGNPSGGQDE